MKLFFRKYITCITPSTYTSTKREERRMDRWMDGQEKKDERGQTSRCRKIEINNKKETICKCIRRSFVKA